MPRFRTMLTACLAAMFTALGARADDWPQFRGPNRDAISRETRLLREWPEGGPKVLWSAEVSEGFGGAAVYQGRAYYHDYDRQANAWLVNCVALDSGERFWQYREERRIRPNHGITRTVPAVDGEYVFSLDPKCVFHCLDAETGKELWRKNLVREHQTMIPAWYTGQCPLIEEDRVIIAPGGDVLAMALEKSSGSPIWQTPNPEGYPMSHVSVMPAEIDGVRQYLYTCIQGAMGIDATDGKLLWFFPWKFNIAVPCSPLHLGDGRVFLTSCYEAETVMIRVQRQGSQFVAEKVFSLGEGGWNSETHTPIVYRDHIFGVGKKRRGLFTCLDFDGKEVWNSNKKASFGLGNYVMADGMFYILEGDTGVLRLLDAGAEEYTELDNAQVLSGPEVWTPMALSDGRLIVRDMTKIVCLRVGGAEAVAAAPLDSQ